MNNIESYITMISPKSRAALTILSYFLGGLGIDRFYAGRIALGIFKIITLAGFGVWWIVDFVLAVTGNMKDASGHLIAKW
ncbi:TM2 domain-containing protein [[Mesomycoplasma] collis]|uniref:TM2 domain-containing protein n=1 Tax=[Mycoplasma] collis TaxID=2127 RepID=UPI000A56F16D|nr:TM2 domain-containing protein [[Mycoplasma] collis]